MLSDSLFIGLTIYFSFGLALSLFDVRHHRLPNLPVAVLTFLLLVINSQQQNPLASITFAFGYLGIFVAMHLVSRAAIGFGDVKFAFPTALAVSWYSQALPQLLALTFGLAGFSALIQIATKRANLHSRIAFGPYLVGGALLDIAISSLAH